MSDAETLHRPAGRAALAAAVALLLWGIYATAWCSDDGFICLRTAENVADGHGLRWNAAERTQTFTSPAWQFLLVAARWLTGESYFTVLAVGAFLAIAAVAVLAARIASGAAAAAAAVALLASSRAFVEYSTSGLENPLGYVTIAAFVAVWFGLSDPDRRLARASLVAGLVALTRFDLGLLLAPCLLAGMRGVRPGRVVRHAIVGALPLLGWMAFSIVYFGSPWPLTAYAKAFSPNVPADQLALRAGDYIGNLAAWDPVTAVTIVVGLVAAATRWPRRGAAPARAAAWPLALGLLIYGAYLVKIGGDFMSGRFFAVPALLAATIVARLPIGPRLAWAILVLAPLAGLALGRTPPWASGPSYGAEVEPPAATEISDERRYYYQRFGLRSPLREPMAPGELTDQLRDLPTLPEPLIQLIGTVGFAGFRCGPAIHIVDWWLCDPLLARLPMIDGVAWKVGHYTRRVPEGYLESLATGENRMRHPGLRPLVDDLGLATRAPLWSTGRFGAIARLLSGAHAAGIAAFVADEYHRPPRLEPEPADPAPEGTPWWQPPMRVVYAGGHAWRIDAVSGSRLRIALDGGDDYVLRWRRRDGGTVATTPVSTPGFGFTGSTIVEVPVPEAVRSGGIDVLWIDPGASLDGVLAVGGFRFVD